MNNNKTVKKKKKTGKGKLRLHALWAKPHRFSAHVTEEQDWQTDVPNVRLARVFGIVLILHVVAVGGILAFKMIERTSTDPDGEAIAAADPITQEIREPSNSSQGAAPEEGVNVIIDDPSRIGMRHYRVRSGDNLLAVARRLEVSVSELEELNKLNKGNELYAGQVLLVPNRQISAMDEKDIHRLIGSPVPDQVVKAEMVGSDSEMTVAVAEVIGSTTAAPESAPVVGASAPAAPVVAPAPVIAKAEPYVEPSPVIPALKPALSPSAPPVVAAAAPKPEVRPAVTVGLKPAPAPATTAAPRALPVASRTVSAPPASAKSYTVQGGDTFYSIARRFGVDYQNLMRVNGISDARKLRLGQELRIP